MASFLHGKIYEISIENDNDSYDAVFEMCNSQILFIFLVTFTRVDHLCRSEISILTNTKTLKKSYIDSIQFFTHP